MFRFKRKFYHECGLSSKEHAIAHVNNIHTGLYHPMIVASMTVLAGGLLLKQAHEGKIGDEVGGLKERGRPD